MTTLNEMNTSRPAKRPRLRGGREVRGDGSLAPANSSIPEPARITTETNSSRSTAPSKNAELKPSAKDSRVSVHASFETAADVYKIGKRKRETSISHQEVLPHQAAGTVASKTIRDRGSEVGSTGQHHSEETDGGEEYDHEREYSYESQSSEAFNASQDVAYLFPFPSAQPPKRKRESSISTNGSTPEDETMFKPYIHDDTIDNELFAELGLEEQEEMEDDVQSLQSSDKEKSQPGCLVHHADSAITASAPSCDESADIADPPFTQEHHSLAPSASGLRQSHRQTIEALCTRTNNADISEHVYCGVQEAMDDVALTFPRHAEDIAVFGPWCLLIWLYVWYRARCGRSNPKFSIACTCGVLLRAGLDILTRGKEDSEILKELLIRELNTLELHLNSMSFFESQCFLSIPLQMSKDHEANLDEDAKTYLEALDKKGLVDFVDTVIEMDAAGNRETVLTKGILGNSLNWVRKELLQMLASVDEGLLRSCINRTVCRDSIIKEHPTRKALKRNREIMSQGPAQYLNMIGDWSGTPPTRSQFRVVYKDLLLYLQDGTVGNNFASELDQLIAPDERWPTGLAYQGLRRYLDWRGPVVNNRHEKSQQRRSIFSGFLTKWQDLLRNKAYGWDAPLPHAFIEIGFSNSPVHRLQDHSHHRNSNYLMNLVEAAFQYRYPGMLHLRQEIILNCFSQSQSWLGEIVFTQISKGYIDNFSGFSHCTAGFSNGGAYRGRGDRDWNKLYHDALQNTDLRANLKKTAEIEAKAAQEIKDKIQHETRHHIELTDAMTTMFAKAKDLGLC